MAVTRVRITFDMYSGRVNPQVTLEGAEADELLNRLAPGDPIAVGEAAEPRAQLGYRGLQFTVTGDRDDPLPTSFTLVAGRLLGPGLRHWVADPEVEDFLCSPQGPAGRALETPAQFGFLAEGLALARADEWWRPSADDDGLPAVTPCPGAPKASLGRWNDATARGIKCQVLVPNWCQQCCNNCYNYATDQRTDTFAQPGRASGRTLTLATTTCPTVSCYAFYDGLLWTPANNNTCTTSGVLVALVMNPGNDYHWYRKNDDGYWSHKPGATAATSLDAAGAKITDPRTCSRPLYPQFCGFMVALDGSPRII
jgi:hypothetical protein